MAGNSKKAGEFENFAEVLDEAEKMASNSWEETFIGDMSDKYKLYGEKMYISEKQITILCRIADKDLEDAPPKPERQTPPPIEDGGTPF